MAGGLLFQARHCQQRRHKELVAAAGDLPAPGMTPVHWWQPRCVDDICQVPTEGKAPSHLLAACRCARRFCMFASADMVTAGRVHIPEVVFLIVCASTRKQRLHTRVVGHLESMLPLQWQDTHSGSIGADTQAKVLQRSLPSQAQRPTQRPPWSRLEAVLEQSHREREVLGGTPHLGERLGVARRNPRPLSLHLRLRHMDQHRLTNQPVEVLRASEPLPKSGATTACTDA